MTKIHEYFRRDINRTIEKVIDYYAQEDRLAREVAEYEVTDNIESCFRKFLDVFGEGVRGGQVTEVGIWVSGFTAAAELVHQIPRRVPGPTRRRRPFLIFSATVSPHEIPAALRTVSKKHPTAVVLLDLGAEQLAKAPPPRSPPSFIGRCFSGRFFQRKDRSARVHARPRKVR